MGILYVSEVMTVYNVAYHKLMRCQYGYIIHNTTGDSITYIYHNFSSYASIVAKNFLDQMLELDTGITSVVVPLL
jgi:hypothetical protein